jgi:phosphomannomutase/phosphoglucomutase
MQINPLIFRNYDIRGVVDVDLDINKVKAIGKAYGSFLQKRSIEKIVCGRDCRLSSDEYQKAFINGVLSVGVDVIDLGLVMTQMMYFGQYFFQTKGGAMLTASHNPKNFNGFKLATDFSQTTGPEEIQELRELTELEDYVVPDKLGQLTVTDIKEEYISDLLNRIHLKRQFKIVIDSHCGTTGIYNPDIFRRAGCEVIEVNTNIDGNFPMGTPDPTDAKLMNGLAKVVVANGAEVGFAFDGDGDRMGLVDGSGQVLWNDIAVAIFAKDVLEKFPKSKIVYNTLCSQVVKEVILQNGGTPIMWNVGHTFIKAKIAEEKATFGGELSGHFFFPDATHGYDDGTYAALRILKYLDEKQLSLNELYSGFPKFISSPEIKIGCPDDQKKEVIANLAIKFKSDFPNALITDESVIPRDDGVRADFADGMIVFRYSQNGPYLTVRFEAKDNLIFEDRRRYVRDSLKRYPEIVWDDQLSINLDFLK